MIADLRAKGADVVIAVTHLFKAEDQAIINKFWRNGLDLLVGGHDHTQMVLKDEEGIPRGFKADSDARTAWRIDIRVPNGGRPLIEGRLITLNEAIPPDPEGATRAKSWRDQVEKNICDKRAKEGKEPNHPDCLSEKIGRTQTLIEMEELANRSQETGFGNW